MKNKIREPDDINIENIKNRVESDPIEHEKNKSRRKFEDRLSRDYVKDDDHARIKREIEKTMKELYGDNSSYSSNEASYNYNNRKL